MMITSQSSSQVRSLLDKCRTKRHAQTYSIFPPCYMNHRLHTLCMLYNGLCDNADASVIEDPYPIWQPPRQPNFYRARYGTSFTTIGLSVLMRNHFCLTLMLSFIGLQSISIAAVALGSIFQSFGTLTVRISEQLSFCSPQQAQCCHIRVARDSSVARSTRDIGLRRPC